MIDYTVQLQQPSGICCWRWYNAHMLADEQSELEVFGRVHVWGVTRDTCTSKPL